MYGTDYELGAYVVLCIDSCLYLLTILNSYQSVLTAHRVQPQVQRQVLHCHSVQSLKDTRMVPLAI